MAWNANKVSAIGVWVYTGITALILIAGTYQTYLSRANNVVSQRAFVAISLPGEYISFDQSAQPKALNFFIMFTNSGNTPTRDLKILVKCAAAVEELQDPWPLLRQGQRPTDTVPIFVGSHASEKSGCSFGFDQIQQMRDGKLFGYLLADAAYYDRIDPGVLHKTQMAFKLAQISIQTNPLAVANLSFAVGLHNCADDECPVD